MGSKRPLKRWKQTKLYQDDSSSGQNAWTKSSGINQSGTIIVTAYSVLCKIIFVLYVLTKFSKNYLLKLINNVTFVDCPSETLLYSFTDFINKCFLRISLYIFILARRQSYKEGRGGGETHSAPFSVLKSLTRRVRPGAQRAQNPLVNIRYKACRLCPCELIYWFPDVFLD